MVLNTPSADSTTTIASAPAIDCQPALYHQAVSSSACDAGEPRTLVSAPEHLIGSILYRTADLFGITLADLTGPRRTLDLVQARFAAAYALRRHCQDMPLCAIGAALGGRDHSTIINALRRAEDLARNDAEYDAKLRTLMSEPSPAEVQHPFGAVAVPSPLVAATAR